MVTYGDGLSDININSLIKFHKSHDRVATVTGVRPSGRFGEIIANHDNQVSEFNEKPQTTSGWIIQILVNAILFATTTIASSPIINSF